MQFHYCEHFLRLFLAQPELWKELLSYVALILGAFPVGAVLAGAGLVAGVVLLAACACLDQLRGTQLQMRDSSALDPIISFPGPPPSPPRVQSGEPHTAEEIRLHSSLPRRLPRVEAKKTTGPQVAKGSSPRERTAPFVPLNASEAEASTRDLTRLSSSLGSATPYRPHASEPAVRRGKEQSNR